MRYATFLALIALSLAGIFVIGKGLTGMVISQTCCFPPDCTQENLCDSTRPSIESPSQIDSSSIYLGLTLVFLSILVYRLLKN